MCNIFWGRTDYISGIYVTKMAINMVFICIFSTLYSVTIRPCILVQTFLTPYSCINLDKAGEISDTQYRWDLDRWKFCSVSHLLFALHWWSCSVTQYHFCLQRPFESYRWVEEMSCVFLLGFFPQKVSVDCYYTEKVTRVLYSNRNLESFLK